ncbi:MAG TPA: glycogen-binding domain-containing protein [Candidatus Eisenbacteria bacterium]
MTDERIENERELNPGDRARLDALSRASLEGRGTGAPLDFAARVMARVEAERAVTPKWSTGLAAFWRRPAVRWASGLAAAALALWVASAALRKPVPETPTLKAAPLSAESSTTVPHRFTIEAPEARRVCLVGDFNDWAVCEVPLVRDETAGTWSVQMELPPGRHEYMFVVDEGWVTDPSAPVSVDDGFGNRNAVIFL